MRFNIDAFLAAPKKYLDQLDTQDIFEFLNYANELYRNAEVTAVSDDMYDLIEAYAKKRDPTNAFFTLVGAPVKEKVKLPEWMGSQDKIRDDSKALASWKKKYPGPYVLSDKLDGISGMFYVNKNKVHLYTRGDGEYGQDVTGIYKWVKDSFGTPAEGMMVRGEFILSKANWERIKHKGANARNVLAGQLNAKKHDPEICQYIEFIAYEYMSSKKPFYESLNELEGMGFRVVPRVLLDEATLTNEHLADYLILRRKSALYEIDGIVVRDNAVHRIMKEKNPKYSFAYKTILTHDEAEVVVHAVEWNVSKDGFIKPTVMFNAVVLNGVTIQKATGFNGAFIEAHGIGPGSRVVIIRSGDVIPHIVRVLSGSANGKPSMPDIPYTWNESHVDLVAVGEGSEEQVLKQMEHFVKTLDIDHVGPGVIRKLYKAGFTTLESLFTVTKKDLLTMEGIQEKGAEKIMAAFKKGLEGVSCLKLMVASNIFGRGFGEKKMAAILETNPEILEFKSIKTLKETEGVAKITATKFLEKLDAFYAFAKKIGMKKGCPEAKPGPGPSKPKGTAEGTLAGKTIVFTGFRDKALEQRVLEAGGKMGTTVSKNTSLVVAADVGEASSKLEKARALGVEVVSREAFVMGM